MALSFSLRRDNRNRRQAERSYCTLDILLSILTSHNSRLSQVSALNRVFEGVEGIDILQVSARPRPAHASMSQAISRCTFDGIVHPICSNQSLISYLFYSEPISFLFYPSPSATRSPACALWRASTCADSLQTTRASRFFDRQAAFSPIPPFLSLTSSMQRDLIVDLLARIEDDDMGVMNIVTQGYVTCCKRQLGCVSFFENTKIIKKVESLLLNRNRSAPHSPFPPLLCHSTSAPLPALFLTSPPASFACARCRFSPSYARLPLMLPNTLQKPCFKKFSERIFSATTFSGAWPPLSCSRPWPQSEPPAFPPARCSCSV
jgi:hypothetical protein